jgi:hypothetical protein
VNFCQYFPHGLSDMGEIRHKISALTLLNVCDCSENGYREGRKRSDVYKCTVRSKDLF